MLSAGSLCFKKSYGFKFHTGRGPVPGINASGMVPTKPRIASSKSCRLANGNVFAISALAFNVAGSGPLGATCPCAIELPAAIVTVIAAVRSSHSDALKCFMLFLSFVVNVIATFFRRNNRSYNFLTQK
jgi:hypothetical protein